LRSAGILPASGEATESREVRYAHLAARMRRKLHAGCVRYVGGRPEKKRPASGPLVSLSKF